MRDMIYDEVVGFVPVEDVDVTFNNEAIQNKMKRCVDHMMAEHNRLEDEATINALRSYGYEVIKWHPYPQEKPPKSKWILVTRKDGFVHTSYIFASDEPVDIIAWAELPKAYEP